MPGGAQDGGAEDLHRMELCLGWIYEYFSRHRLDEAREGSLLFLLYALTYASRCFVRHRLLFVLPLFPDIFNPYFVGAGSHGSAREERGEAIPRLAQFAARAFGSLLHSSAAPRQRQGGCHANRFRKPIDA